VQVTPGDQVRRGEWQPPGIVRVIDQGQGVDGHGGEHARERAPDDQRYHGSIDSVCPHAVQVAVRVIIVPSSLE
jgi:hypothetical protein